MAPGKSERTRQHQVKDLYSTKKSWPVSNMKRISLGTLEV